MRFTNFKLQRLQRGLLQVELAQRARIERTRLSLIENGHVVPRPEELAALARALNVSVDALREAAAA